MPERQRTKARDNLTPCGHLVEAHRSTQAQVLVQRFLAQFPLPAADGHRGDAIANPGVPTWWPGFCLAYDVIAAGYLSWLLKSGRVRAAI